MTTFRTKSYDVEAILVADALLYAESDWEKLPEWLRDSYEGKNALVTSIVFASGEIMVTIPEQGLLRGGTDCWVVRHPSGALRVLAPEEFARMYDPAEAPPLALGLEEGEVLLVARDDDAEQRSITAEYDPSCKLVQFVQYGEEVFGTLEPVEPEEWQQIVGRLGRAAPFMRRVLGLVKEIERIADGAEPVPDLQRELRAAVKTFAGAIEPEEAVEVAHAADKPAPITAAEAEALFACYSGGQVDAELLNSVTPKLEAIVGKELVP